MGNWELQTSQRLRQAGPAGAALIRAFIIASALVLLLHYLDSYFDWHLFSEAGGHIDIATILGL
ncbi:MAG: hypothetical protein A3H97_00200 [Acidobacteria bacterium RIFCSPLOWO2_02_FULL_65_29]|nr:MAG: hypothetical protein A3H97_00200 [Acidobacteria bacterium RIFCSPLOWO2_02_FULL_65_29]